MARWSSSSEARVGRARGLVVAVLLAAGTIVAGAALAPVRARADDEGGEDGGRGARPRVTTTVVVIPEGDATTAQATALSIGLRRGLREVSGVRFVDPVDVLSPRDTPEEVATAQSDLDAVADMVRSGDAHEAEARALAAIDVFEANLVNVPRSNLADAYMLAALSHCRQRDRSACNEGIERVIAFREGLEYDASRYPSAYRRLFDEVKRSTIDHGGRGSIEVTTDPEGAEVFIDGRSYGPSPVVAEGLLVGDHYVTLELLGYEKQIQRARVSANEQQSQSYELEPSDRALLLHRALPHIRSELGEARAGQYIRGMTSYLFVKQAVIGVVRPGAAGQVDVSLYLYDLRTHFLLAQKRETLPGDPQDAAARVRGAELAQALYHGVDLSGAVAAPDDALIVEPARPLYERWWFWTAVGVVVASGITAAVLISSSGEPEVPEGWTRIDGQVR